MLIKSLSAISKTKVDMEDVKNVFRQVPIGKSDNTPNISFRVFTVKPGGYTPYHSHESEHVNYVISGTGAIKDEKGELHSLKAGDFSLIQPREKHQYRNISDTDDFVFICAVMKKYE